MQRPRWDVDPLIATAIQSQNGAPLLVGYRPAKGINRVIFSLRQGAYCMTY